MARILIIEDDVDLRDVMKCMLEELGHEVDKASDGNEGLSSQSTNPANLIITDLHMPGKDGLETIKELRRKDDDVKIIAMSGANTFMVETNLESSLIQGANRTFIKPFDHNEFLEAVNELIAS